MRHTSYLSSTPESHVPGAVHHSARLSASSAVYSINDKFPVLKVGHQPPTQQGINVGIDSRQTMEGVRTMDAPWGIGIRMRRGLWFVFGSIRGAGGGSGAFPGHTAKEEGFAPGAISSFGYPGLNPPDRIGTPALSMSPGSLPTAQGHAFTPGKCSRQPDDALRPASSKSSAHRMPGEFLEKSVVWASGFFTWIRFKGHRRRRGRVPPARSTRRQERIPPAPPEGPACR